jgi:uncharacterized membrane protein
MDQNQNQAQHHHNKPTFGQNAADRATSFIGSWKFIIIQTIVLVIWITLNAFELFFHWDPYPFIFLNLVVGFVASYSAPIIMMSQNRSEERERYKAEIDLATDRKAEREIEEIQKKLENMDKKINEIKQILSQK